jgi:hypothetical protein
MRIVRTLSRWTFALAVAGSLALGATEAFASPRGGDEEGRPWCNPAKCNEDCGGYGICRGYECLCA